jgi:hypothetical protein
MAMRWIGAAARDNWFDAGLRAGMGGVTWPVVGGIGAIGIGAIASGLTFGLLPLAGVAAAIWKRRSVHGYVLEQLTPAFGHFWHWVSEDGRARGAMTTLGARRISGAGSWLDLIDELHVDASPTAAEVIAAGPYAVARALDERVSNLPRLDPVHALLLAAVAHEVARGAIRAWRATRWIWVHPQALTDAVAERGTSRPPILTWARGRAAPPPAGTLEHAVIEAVEAQTGRTGGALMRMPGGPRVPASLGDPYRGAAILDATPPPPAVEIELRSLAIGDILRRHRGAESSAEAAVIAERLLAVIAGAGFLAAHVISEAENVRILQGF